MLIAKTPKAAVAAAATLLATAGMAAPALAQSDPLIPGVTGCGASGNKQAGGAIVGALAGGLLGNSVSGHNRTTGTLLGAAVGGAAGSAVGCQMQHNDEQRAAQAEAAEQREADPQGGPQDDKYELSSGVARASYEEREDTLVATRTVALHASPATRGRAVGKLRRGERFDALAQVRGTDWILVGRDGIGVGYVQSDYTRPDRDRYADR